MNTCDTWEFNSAKAKAMRLKAEAHRWDARVCELLGDAQGAMDNRAVAESLDSSARGYDKWASEAPDAPPVTPPSAPIVAADAQRVAVVPVLDALPAHTADAKPIGMVRTLEVLGENREALRIILEPAKAVTPSADAVLDVLRPYLADHAHGPDVAEEVLTVIAQPAQAVVPKPSECAVYPVPDGAVAVSITVGGTGGGGSDGKAPPAALAVPAEPAPNPESADFKSGMALGRAESEFLAAAIKNPACSLCGATCAKDAEAKCRLGGDSCPGTEWPLANLWALAQQPAAAVPEDKL